MREVRLKQVASVRPSNVDKKEVDGQEPVQLCNYTDVYYQDYITSGLKFMSATATRDQIASFELQRGDVLITKDSETADDIAVPALVTEDLFGVLCGYHLALVRPSPEAVDPRFLFRALSSDYVNRQFEVGATGVTRHGLRTGVIRSVRVPFPPMEVQKLIADFLDRETHRIDTLVDTKRRMIELLEEKQESLLHREVSAEGLANGVRRDSGVHWIGEVPNSWTVTSIRRITSEIETGGTPPTSESRFYENGTVPWYGPSSLGSGFEVEKPVKYINQSAVDEGQAKVFPAGSTLVTVIGATLGRSGYLASEGSSNQQITCLVPTEDVYSKYLAWWIKSCAQILVSMAQRTTLPILSNQSLADLPVVLPPLQEQERIVERMERSRRIADTLKERLQDQLNFLAEYRQALITQAVTGQLDEATLKGDKPVGEAVGVIPE